MEEYVRKRKVMIPNIHWVIMGGRCAGVLPPFQPRGIEIRGHAQALPDGGQQISPDFSPALIRLTPERILSWNLTSGDPAQTHSARNV
jgi:pyridoxamine 5'-phosphate oxidase family protein